jgi:hypothetical protein
MVKFSGRAKIDIQRNFITIVNDLLAVVTVIPIAKPQLQL